MGDPLNQRLTGVVLTDAATVGLPWWAVGVLNWLAMVHAMQQGSGELAMYGDLVEQCLEFGEGYAYTNVKTGRTTFLNGPAAIYGLYQSFCLRVKSEAAK